MDNKVTGKKAGTAASATMQDRRATEPEKKAAASALAQTRPRPGKK